MKPEYELQRTCVTWLRYSYPKLLFMSDTVASVKLTMPQAVRNKSIQCPDFHCPDIIIFKPTDKYHGLFIELKAETPYKKNGKLKSGEHLWKQRETMERLEKLGYKCSFCWSLEMFIGLVNSYLE